MAVTYTVTAADVSSVSNGSRLTEGVIFDWTNQRISVPASVGQVTAQWAVDNCRFAESLTRGIARPQIIVGAGKVQIGVDADTGSAIATPTIAIFLGEWRLVTQKTSGIFVVRDIYMNSDASSPIPYVDVANVFIQYLTSVTGAVATVDTGGGGFTSTDRAALQSTAADSAIARQAVTNRYEIKASDNTGTLYDDDGTTPLIVHELLDKDGNPATQQVYERVPE